MSDNVEILKWKNRDDFKLTKVRVVRTVKDVFIVEGQIKKLFFFNAWVRLSSVNSYDSDYWSGEKDALKVAETWIRHYEQAPKKDEVIVTLDVKTIETHPEHYI